MRIFLSITTSVVFFVLPSDLPNLFLTLFTVLPSINEILVFLNIFRRDANNIS